VNEALLQQLGDAQTALIAALDAQDLAAIDAANTAVAIAVEEVRTVGGWHARADLRDNLIDILEGAGVARGHVNALADRNRRDLDKLISLAGPPRAAAYSRSGKLG
jgi:hypothetical protein